MNEITDRFLELVHGLEDVTHQLTADRAHAEFDEVTLQVFWQRWPYISSWTGSLWRMLSEELADAASPHTDPERHELGESG